MNLVIQFTLNFAITYAVSYSSFRLGIYIGKHLSGVNVDKKLPKAKKPRSA